MTFPRGYIVYRGPSLLNGEPIVAVVIAQSDNTKTGDVAQSYILPDNGERPTEALRSGADSAVCGDCKHRPLNAGTCYVVVRQGATKVWDAMRLGRYPDFTPWPDIVGEILHGRMLRVGTYGDPAAVPIEVWRTLTSQLSGWVGYTHQWRQSHAQPLRAICMASVDSAVEADAARALGWRTFRVRLPDEALLERESTCPASAEAGHKLQCAGCRACNGAASGRRGSVAIVIHGNHPERRAARFASAQMEALA